MLTRGDEYPIHQIAEPVACAGTDRNFYDRYFFNGYTPDGSEYFAVAFGVYPHLNIADAHFSVVRGNVQHCVHASRFLNSERMDLQVGPIRIEIIEPLRTLRVVVEDECGIAADLRFEGRSFPIEEPRFTHRIGPRTFMDYIRLTQNGRISGWITVDGRRVDLPKGSFGTRDRSWGVRPVGSPDTQPHVPAILPGFFWQWTPLNFADKSIFFHVNADATGRPFNIRATIAPDGAGADGLVETHETSLAMELQSGTRWARNATLDIRPAGAAPLRIRFEPIGRFQMRGIGYLNAAWGHGTYKGERCVEREDIALDKVNPLAMEYLHIQALSRVVLEQQGRPAEQGMGTFEQLVLGRYQPLGFTGMADGAP